MFTVFNQNLKWVYYGHQQIKHRIDTIEIETKNQPKPVLKQVGKKYLFCLKK